METAYTTTEGTREMSENEQQVKPTEHPSEPQAKILRSEEIFEGRRQILSRTELRFIVYFTPKTAN